MNQLVLMAMPNGKWVLPASDEFLGALGDPNPDYDGPGFAIRNLGFIRLRVLDHTLVEVELHPRNVAKRALRAVIEQVLTANVKQFRIKYLNGTWQSEISASAEHTVSRLEELCSTAYRPVPASRFQAEGRDFAALIDSPENKHHNFRPLAQKWRVASGQYNPTIPYFAAGHEVLPSFAIVGVPAKGREPVFRVLGPDWAGKDAVGLPVESLPDREHGAWAAGFFRAVAVSGQPRYDVVSAAMRSQAGPGVPQRVVYERLLLPWRASSDEVFVTSCAMIVEKDEVDSPSTSSAAK